VGGAAGRGGARLTRRSDGSGQAARPRSRAACLATESLYVRWWEPQRRDALVSSALLLVEGRRAAARCGALALVRAHSALATITLLPLDDAVLERAAGLRSPELRSLDALHLATALELAANLDRFYCYDRRLADAAAMLGIEVRNPV
jgi:predicted nucleic acid-binding protein